MPFPPLSHKLRTSVRDLQRAVNRDATRTFVVEGVRACEALAGSTLLPDLVILREDADHRARQVAMTMAMVGVDVVTATMRDMELMSDAVTPQDIMAVVPFPIEHPLGDRVVVLDGIADPGNAGTIVRTAAWFGFTDVVFLAGCVDPFHPKVVRSTVGALTRINVLRDSSIVAFNQAWNARGPIIAAVVERGITPDSVDRSTSAVALLIGGEANGLSDAALRSATIRLTIPGTGDVESLNAAVAAAILCYAFRGGGQS